jgi:hypothetical protein
MDGNGGAIRDNVGDSMGNWWDFNGKGWYVTVRVRSDWWGMWWLLTWIWGGKVNIPQTGSKRTGSCEENGTMKADGDTIGGE